MRKLLAFSLGAVLLLSLSAINVYASQVLYSPLMGRLMRMDDIDAAREFLANIKGVTVKKSHGGPDVYAIQSAYLNDEFDNIFEREVNVSQLNIEKAIQHYQGLLALNDNSRDVLVQLAILYEEKGDSETAQYFYGRAKTIDPWIEVDGFE